MLISALIGGCSELVAAAAGSLTIRAPEQSEAVERIQAALVCLGFELPEAGCDGIFGAETGTAVSAFKESRGLKPADPVVGVGTTTQLDLEIAYLEDTFDDAVLEDDRILASNPLFGDFIDIQRGGLGIPDRILKFFELSDEFCLPFAPLVGSTVAQKFGEIVDPRIRDDYIKLQGFQGLDFFDLSKTATEYELFLELHNPTVPQDVLHRVGAGKRPDILRHRSDQPEWYETKPMSPSGVVEFLAKGKELKANYAQGFPYVPGKIYRPSDEIHLATLLDGPHTIEVFIEPRRPAPAMILYRICLRGDYVELFNKARIIGAILAILVAIAPEVLAAAEVATFVAAVKELALSLSLVLPSLVLAK
jgi:peptidoglycan hydrolase-like protein with peptidoglycan-binding domain